MNASRVVIVVLTLTLRKHFRLFVALKLFLLNSTVAVDLSSWNNLCITFTKSIVLKDILEREKTVNSNFLARE
jgi:hypothetical protein